MWFARDGRNRCGCVYAALAYNNGGGVRRGVPARTPLRFIQRGFLPSGLVARLAAPPRLAWHAYSAGDGHGDGVVLALYHHGGMARHDSLGVASGDVYHLAVHVHGLLRTGCCGGCAHELLPRTARRAERAPHGDCGSASYGDARGGARRHHLPAAQPYRRMVYGQRRGVGGCALAAPAVLHLSVRRRHADKLRERAARHRRREATDADCVHRLLRHLAARGLSLRIRAGLRTDGRVDGVPVRTDVGGRDDVVEIQKIQITLKYVPVMSYIIWHIRHKFL